MSGRLGPVARAPHKSSVHRLAAIALYRALLSQITAAAPNLPALPTTSPPSQHPAYCPPSQRTTKQSTDDTAFCLRNIVRNRFRTTRHLTSERQLAVYFAAGYEALDHLDSIVAEAAARSTSVATPCASATYLANLAATAPASMHRAESLTQQRARRRTWAKVQAAHEQESRRAARVAVGEVIDGSQHGWSLPASMGGANVRHTKSYSFDRRLKPRAELAGPRKVPRMFAANWLPVLRFGKPQSPVLSGYLAAQIRKRQRKQNQVIDLELMRGLAGLEDGWDRMMVKAGGGRKNVQGDGAMINHEAGATDEPPWTEGIDFGTRIVKDYFRRMEARTRIFSGKMHAVVLREQRAAMRERAEHKAARRKAWLEKMEAESGKLDV